MLTIHNHFSQISARTESPEDFHAIYLYYHPGPLFVFRIEASRRCIVVQRTRRPDKKKNGIEVAKPRANIQLNPWEKRYENLLLTKMEINWWRKRFRKALLNYRNKKR